MVEKLGVRAGGSPNYRPDHQDAYSAGVEQRRDDVRSPVKEIPMLDPQVGNRVRMHPLNLQSGAPPWRGQTAMITWVEEKPRQTGIINVEVRFADGSTSNWINAGPLMRVV